MAPQNPPPPFSKQRRSPRHDFGAVVELTDLESGQTKVALVRALSLHGCFVKTEMPFRIGASVALRIAHAGSDFSAIGRVVVRTPDRGNKGIGVEFTEIDSADQERLEGYLVDLIREEKSARFAAIRKKPGVRTATGRQAEDSAKTLGAPKYPWQQKVIEAFQSPPDSLPAKINAAERAIAERLADANEADIDEKLALTNALQSLHVLIAETRRPQVFKTEEKNSA